MGGGIEPASHEAPAVVPGHHLGVVVSTAEAGTAAKGKLDRGSAPAFCSDVVEL